MIYFVSINLIAFVLCGLDKWRAVHRYYRISENCLLLFTFIGGCFGMVLGMYFFHHKTKKFKFKLVYLACFGWILWFMK